MTPPTRWELCRVRPARIRTLEIWNLPAPEGQFWQAVGLPRVEAMRRDGRSDREIGDALAASLVPAVLQLHETFQIDTLFLGGGLLEIAALRSGIEAAGLPFALVFASDATWVGEPGGQALLRQAGVPDGAVVDVGQTAIKASARGLRIVKKRDVGLLPYRFIDASGHSRGCATEAAAAFLGGALGDLLAAATPADAAVVLALPCPLDEACTPGPCTYGWEGDRALLPRALQIVDERTQPWRRARPRVLILNDAELAAVSAGVEARSRGRTLCLTLGFGPGGALVEG